MFETEEFFPPQSSQKQSIEQTNKKSEDSMSIFH